MTLCPAHHRALHQEALRICRNPDGSLHIERRAPIPEVDPAWRDLLYSVLECHPMDSFCIAQYLGITTDEAERFLRREARRLEVLRSPQGLWVRPLAAA